MNDYIKTTKDGSKYHDFPNISSLVTYITTTENNEVFANTNASKKNGKSFTGTESLDEALKLIKFGWEAGTLELNKNINLKATSTSFKSNYNVIGGNVSVPRYLLKVMKYWLISLEG